MAKWKSLVVVPLTAAWSQAALAQPSAKTAGWVNYWDNPDNVHMAKLVGVGLVVVIIIIGALGWVSKRQEEQRRSSRRS